MTLSADPNANFLLVKIVSLDRDAGFDRDVYSAKITCGKNFEREISDH